MISIPSGTIKRMPGGDYKFGLDLFQFLLVRLKECSVHSTATVAIISIPSGTIKS